MKEISNKGSRRGKEDRLDPMGNFIEEIEWKG